VIEQSSEPSSRPPRTEEEMARIALAAREAKTTIIAVAAVALGGIVIMFMITIVIVALRLL
jgi:hypothetical protein